MSTSKTILLLILGLSAVNISAQDAVPTSGDSDVEVVRHFMRELGFHADFEEQLRAGQILTSGMPEMENTELELAVSAVMLLVRRSPEVVIKAYMDGEVFRANHRVLEWQPIDSQLVAAADIQNEFSRVAYQPGEESDAAALLSSRPQKAFNLSQAEINQLASAQSTDPIVQASDQYRSVLAGRYQSYLAGGHEDIAPYFRSAKNILTPGDDLVNAINEFAFVESYFPMFYKVASQPPSRGDVLGDNLEQRFFWLKQITSKRPNFVLSHNVALIDVRHSIAMEQQFFVGHSYNAMVALIGCLPFEGDTVVFYANRVFTDQITGFASGLKRNIGRDQVEQQVAELLNKIRDELESLSD